MRTSRVLGAGYWSWLPLRFCCSSGCSPSGGSISAGMIPTGISRWHCSAHSCSESFADSASRIERASFVPAFAVLFEIEHGARFALGQQPQSSRDFLIGLDLAAEIAAEAILVELLA